MLRHAGKAAETMVDRIAVALLASADSPGSGGRSYAVPPHGGRAAAVGNMPLCTG